MPAEARHARASGAAGRGTPCGIPRAPSTGCTGRSRRPTSRCRPAVSAGRRPPGARRRRTRAGSRAARTAARSRAPGWRTAAGRARTGPSSRSRRPRAHGLRPTTVSTSGRRRTGRPGRAAGLDQRGGSRPPRSAPARGGPLGLVAKLQHLLVVLGRHGRVRRAPPPPRARRRGTAPAAARPIRPCASVGVVREDPPGERAVRRLDDERVVVGIADHDAAAGAGDPRHLREGPRAGRPGDGTRLSARHASNRLVLEGQPRRRRRRGSPPAAAGRGPRLRLAGSCRRSRRYP